MRGFSVSSVNQDSSYLPTHLPVANARSKPFIVEGNDSFHRVLRVVQHTYITATSTHLVIAYRTKLTDLMLRKEAAAAAARPPSFLTPSNSGLSLTQSLTHLPA